MAFGQQMRWITYDGRSFDRKEKDVAGGRDHQTVSYTHLDVYKRQVLLDALNNAIKV